MLTQGGPRERLPDVLPAQAVYLTAGNVIRAEIEGLAEMLTTVQDENARR